MICQIEKTDIPGINQPPRRRCPETAYAKRQVEEFIASGYDVAEITDIPTACNTTRLYGALQNAAFALTARAKAIRVMRRGGRLFLMTAKAWEEAAWKAC